MRFRHRQRQPVRFIPVLHVNDLAAAITFWKSVGCTVEQFDHMYGFVICDGDEVVHLRVDPTVGPSPRIHATGEIMIIVNDPVTWWTRCESAGLDPTPLVDEPWGVTEFRITDPWGTMLRIGHPH